MKKQRVYFVGRSKKQVIELRLKYASLIREVDDVCHQVKSKGKAINLLFITTEMILTGTDTAEGLYCAISLVYYSRTRFIINLFPFFQQASSLRRVVSVFAGAKEGPVDTDDFQGRKISMTAMRGHVSSMIMLSLVVLAEKAPDMSFINNFPGSVKSNLVRGGEGAAGFALKMVFQVIRPFVSISSEECRERHFFLATSVRYPPGHGQRSGAAVEEPVKVASAIGGKEGRGVYSIESDGESAGTKVEELLTRLRDDGAPEKLWNHTEEEFRGLLNRNRRSSPYLLD